MPVFGICSSCCYCDPWGARIPQFFAVDLVIKKDRSIYLSIDLSIYLSIYIYIYMWLRAHLPPHFCYFLFSFSQFYSKNGQKEMLQICPVSVHVWPWAFVRTFACPSVWPQPPSPFCCQASLCLMGSTFPSFPNICMHRSLSSWLLTTFNATSFWMFGTFNAQTYNQHQRLKTLRRTWSCKGLPRLFGQASRELPVRIR